MRGFKLHSVLGSEATPSLRPYLIKNSEALTIGDAVNVNSDGELIALTTSDERPVGVVCGFVGPNGQITDPDTGTRHTVTVESDNVTDKMVKALVADGIDNLYEVDFDASLAQTNLCQFFDLNNAYEPDVATASDSSGVVQLVQLDPKATGDDSRGLVRIAEHQYAHL